jgi:DNA-binding transcriptional MerR regulator
MVLASAAAVARAKSPEAFRTISEVSVELDIPQHVLRFWEGRFAQVRPIKRAGGRRYYRPEDVDLLRGIRALLYSDGFTIRGVQKILRERGLRHVAEIGRASCGAPVTEPSEPVVTEPTHARAALAALQRAHAERPIGWQLPEDRRVKLELLLAELLHLKVRLREAREGAVTPV